MIRSLTSLRALTFMVVIATVPAIQAQSSATIRSISNYTVKIERNGDLIAAIKEYNAILKKAGYDKARLTFRSLTGPTHMALVTTHQKWAELDDTLAQDPRFKDSQAELARILVRINDSFISANRVIDLVNSQMSISSAEPPKMVMVWTAHVKEGKMRDVIALERDEYLPAIKAAGFKSYNFAVARFGAPSNEIHAVTGLEKWADFDSDNPIRKAMGDAKFTDFSTRMNALLDDFTYEMYRYDADLSYVPAKK